MKDPDQIIDELGDFVERLKDARWGGDEVRFIAKVGKLNYDMGSWDDGGGLRSQSQIYIDAHDAVQKALEKAEQYNPKIGKARYHVTRAIQCLLTIIQYFEEAKS